VLLVHPHPDAGGAVATGPVGLAPGIAAVLALILR
jgi:hypothetical protein